MSHNELPQLSCQDVDNWIGSESDSMYEVPSLAIPPHPSPFDSSCSLERWSSQDVSRYLSDLCLQQGRSTTYLEFFKNVSGRQLIDMKKETFLQLDPENGEFFFDTRNSLLSPETSDTDAPLTAEETTYPFHSPSCHNVGISPPPLYPLSPATPYPYVVSSSQSPCGDIHPAVYTTSKRYTSYPHAKPSEDLLVYQEPHLDTGRYQDPYEFEQSHYYPRQSHLSYYPDCYVNPDYDIVRAFCNTDISDDQGSFAAPSQHLNPGEAALQGGPSRDIAYNSQGYSMQKLKTGYPVQPPPHRSLSARRPRERGPKLYEFLWNMLHNRSTNPSLICWEDHKCYTFRLVNPNELARRWGGRRASSKDLPYEHFARALRYYYKKGILESVPGKKLIYKFGQTTFAKLSNDSM